MPAREFEDDLDPSESPAITEPPRPSQPPMKDSVDQLDVAARLQAKWLQRMEFLLDSGLVTSTDLATLSRVLLQNGWSLDPKKLPKGIAALVGRVEFDENDRPRLVKSA